MCDPTTIPLRHLQREAINFALQRFTACIEHDDVNPLERFFLLGMGVGQGKTRVICAFIKKILDIGEELTDVVPSILIAVPPTIVEQWSTELSLWGIEFVKITLPKQSLAMEKYPRVCLSSFTSLKGMFGYLGNPSVMIVDEPDTIQIPGISDSEGTVMTVIVSGTLGIVEPQSNLRWDPIKFFSLSVGPMPTKWRRWDGEIVGLLEALTFRGVPADLQIPPPIVTVIRVTLPGMIAAIFGAVPAEAVRLLEAGATGAFMGAMGFPIFPSIQDLCDRTRENLDERIAEEKGKLNKAVTPYTVEIRRKKLDELVATRRRLEDSVKENAKKCDICGDGEADPNRETLMCQQCLNVFCKGCMLGWIKAEHIDCPACRRIFTGKLSAVIPGGAEGGGDASLPLTSVKNGFITALRTVMQDPIPVKRILVAGSHHEIFAQARELCSECGCQAVQLTGTVAMRQRQVDDFKTRGTSTAFIINSNESAAGIDIPELTHTIIVGNMPTAIIDQIVGRGQRPGRIGRQKVFVVKVE